MNWIQKLFGREEMKCKTCEVLREQLDYERSEKRELLDVLTAQLKPQVIVQSNTELKAMTPRFTRFSRRRAELERIDRESTQIKINSPVIGKSDEEKLQEVSTEELETELGIERVEP
jgi:hypothetical protein